MQCLVIRLSSCTVKCKAICSHSDDQGWVTYVHWYLKSEFQTDHKNKRQCSNHKSSRVGHCARGRAFACSHYSVMLAGHAAIYSPTLLWRHNDRDGASNHQPHDCLLNCLFRRKSKKTSKLRFTGLCVGNSPVTGVFPAQRASNAEYVSIWWHHHEHDRFRYGASLLSLYVYRFNWKTSLLPSLTHSGLKAPYNIIDDIGHVLDRCYIYRFNWKTSLLPSLTHSGLKDPYDIIDDIGHVLDRCYIDGLL